MPRDDKIFIKAEDYDRIFGKKKNDDKEQPNGVDNTN